MRKQVGRRLTRESATGAAAQAALAGVLFWSVLEFFRSTMLGRRRKPKSQATAAALERIYQTGATRTLETAAELELQAFLLPYAFEDVTEVVFKLTAAGFMSVESLRALNEKALEDAGFESREAEKILLGVFLHSYGMPQYGGGCIAIGCEDLLRLHSLSDAGLKRAGVATIGHRRQLQKFLREDERVQGKIARREAEIAEARREAARNLTLGQEAKPSLSKSPAAEQRAARKKKSTTAAEPDGPSLPIRFEPVPLQPWDRTDADPEAIASLPTGSSGSIHAWSQPWATIFNSALQGAPPRHRAESHYEAQPAQDGFQLVSNDGSVMHVW